MADYHREWRAFIVPRVFQRVSIVDHDALPRFAYQDEPERRVLARVGLNLGALMVPALVLAIVGFQPRKNRDSASSEALIGPNQLPTV